MTNQDTQLLESLKEQQEYYNERAGEYNEWWNFSGKFDQGEAVKNEALLNRENFENYFKQITDSKYYESNQKIKVLELAPGTGNFTKYFLNERFDLRCEEGSLEMINVLKSEFSEQISKNTFSIHQTDLFSDSFKPEANTYDIVFMGFFVSHVPVSLFDSFFGKCRDALKPNGRLFFIDSYYHKNYQTKNHESKNNNIRLEDGKSDNDFIIERKLLSGKTFKIVKIGFTAESAIQTFTSLGLVMQRSDQIIINSTYIFGSFSKKSN